MNTKFASRAITKDSGSCGIEYTLQYNQSKILLRGSTKIDSNFLKDRFGIAIDRDRFGDLLSIEALPNKQGVILKKLTFKNPVEYKENPQTVAWKPMLISDALEVTSQLQLRIGKYLFSLEVTSNNPVSKPLERSNKPQLSALSTIKPLSNGSRILNSYRDTRDEFAPLDPFRFETQNPDNSVSFGRKFNGRTQKESIEAERPHKHDEELSQDMWRYYEDLLNDDSCWEGVKENSKEKKMNNASDSLAPSTTKISFTGLLKPKASEANINMSLEKENSTTRKQSELSFANPRVDSRNSLLQSNINRSMTEHPSSQKTIKLFQDSAPKLPIKEEKSEISYISDSPYVHNARRRNNQLFDSESDLKKEGCDELDKTLKKVKMNDQKEEHKAHNRVEKKLLETTPEDSIKKKVTRRKKLHLEEDEGPSQFNSEDSWKYNNFSSLDNSRSRVQPDSFNPRAEERTTLERSSFKTNAQRSFEENKIEGIAGELNEAEPPSHSQTLRSGSNLTDNQLKRLKKLVVDKRDAAGKQSAEKGKNSQSQTLKEVCSICISDLIEEIGRLNGCTHVFCYSCIFDWAKVTNDCPLCRKRFSEITKFSKDNEKLETVSIKFKNQTYQCESQDAVINEEADDSCYVCAREDNPDVMLICDSCHFHCCHIYCCDPPLSRVPEGDWLCAFCLGESGEQSHARRRNDAFPILENPYRLRLPQHRDREQQTLLERLFEQADNLSSPDQEIGHHRSFHQTDDDDELVFPNRHRRQQVANFNRRNSRSRNSDAGHRQRRSIDIGVMFQRESRDHTHVRSNDSFEETFFNAAMNTAEPAPQNNNGMIEPTTTNFNQSTVGINNLESFRMQPPNRNRRFF